MKLSDVKGDRTFDVIADLIEPISNIAMDGEVSSLFKREACPEDMEPREFMVDRIKKSAPKLLKGHKGDIITIISTIKGVPEEEYLEGLNMASLIADLMELLSDEEFISFLS